MTSRSEPTFVCLDVHYRAPGAVVGGVLFHEWRDERPALELIAEIDHVPPYRPGRFYVRELPCLTALLDTMRGTPDVVIIDGYVWLDGAGRKGLGAHLYDALGGKATVVGIAKSRFRGVVAEEVLRGRSRRPLFVTTAGMDATEAAKHVRAMKGEHRIPTLIRRVDELCRGYGPAFCSPSS